MVLKTDQIDPHIVVFGQNIHTEDKALGSEYYINSKGQFNDLENDGKLLLPYYLGINYGIKKADI